MKTHEFPKLLLFNITEHDTSQIYGPFIGVTLYFKSKMGGKIMGLCMQTWGKQESMQAEAAGGWIDAKGEINFNLFFFCPIFVSTDALGT